MKFTKIVTPLVLVALSALIAKPAQAQYMTREVSKKVHTDLLWKAQGLELLKENGYSHYYIQRAAEQGARAVDACAIGELAKNCVRELERFQQYRQDAMNNR